MADSRFYDNRGPFTLAEICAKAAADFPAGADGGQLVSDVAGIESAGPSHLTFCLASTRSLVHSGRGFCLIPRGTDTALVARTVQLIPCQSVLHAFAAAARMFYPDCGQPDWQQDAAVHQTAQIDDDVLLGPGTIIGPNVEIGQGTRIGPNTVLARGVAIGRNCEIGSNVSIACSYIGDEVLILPGAQIGQPGFGFASAAIGHVKIPQLGRVIVQDRVEIGAATTIDRGALGDTVIGEGTKIDNLVQIGHNTQVGRHCIIVAQAGISGSCELGDFVVLGGQTGVADHARIGAGARLAARCAATPGDLPGGQDYGGVPARPMKQWARELAAVTLLARRRKQDRNG
jgi:UDP-3-O-[3-hydroxymyristoyl] glucosamine N-acyltransferase